MFSLWAENAFFSEPNAGSILSKAKDQAALCIGNFSAYTGRNLMFRFAQHGLCAVANALCTRWRTPSIRKPQIRVISRGFEEKPLGIKGFGQTNEFNTDSNGPAAELRGV
jgi:hypothetical protein